LAILGLALLSLAGQAIRFLTVYDEAFGLIPLVYMGKALSIPTMFTVLLYFVAFVLLCFISTIKVANKDRFGWQWCGLAGLALYLAFDKGTALHTYVFKQIRTWVGGRLFFFPAHRWEFSLILILIFLAAFYVKFIMALPKKTRLLALLSLATYYAGFLFIERFGYDFAAVYSSDSLIYSLILTLGKTLQMSGLAMAILLLLDYVQTIMLPVSHDELPPVTENPGS
jgi:hypothetical protein